MMMDKSPVKVRFASENDLKAVTEIAQSTFPLACPPESKISELERYRTENLSYNNFKEIINEASNKLWVAVIDSKTVGFCLVKISSNTKAELSKLYVVPEYHGRGAASMLANAAISFAKSRKIKVVTLSVFHGNNRAKSFYKRLGFKYAGSVDFPMGNELHKDDVMELVIAEQSV